ncbi:MAG: SURF1 family protein [Bowdeniella nasicola]|nr:SURF1 family protein [Bowdeniella nasicola]
MSRSYRFLTSGRWVGLIVTGLVVMTTCIFLGLWQWGRYEYKKELVAQFDRAYDAPVQTMSQVLEGGVSVDRAREWQPVSLTGDWASTQSILVRHRTVSGTGAYRVLAVLRAEAGDRSIDVLVDRGWVPVSDEAPEVPALDSATVRLEGRLRPPERADSRDVVPGQTLTINPEQVHTALNLGDDDVALFNGYVQITSGADGLEGYPRPERDLGPHLSYAFQWWVFAAGVVVGLVVLARREAADHAGAVVHRKKATSEREEDELLDAQLGQGAASD